MSNSGSAFSTSGNAEDTVLQLKKITNWQLPFRTSFAWREHADFTSWIFQFLNKVNISAID